MLSHFSDLSKFQYICCIYKVIISYNKIYVALMIAHCFMMCFLYYWKQVLAVSRVMVAWQPIGISMGVYDICHRYKKFTHLSVFIFYH